MMTWALVFFTKRLCNTYNKMLNSEKNFFKDIEIGEQE